jgi:predicted RNA-binding Zn ribbon-like protein
MADFRFDAGDPFLDLLNTRPGGDGPDLLRTNDDLVRWMSEAVLIDAGDRPWRWNDKADPLLPRVKRLRERVREQVEAVASGKNAAPDVLRTLQAEAAHAPPGKRIQRPDELYAILARAAVALLSKPPAGLGRQSTAGGGTVWTYQGA